MAGQALPKGVQKKSHLMIKSQTNTYNIPPLLEPWDDSLASLYDQTTWILTSSFRAKKDVKFGYVGKGLERHQVRGIYKISFFTNVSRVWW